LKISREMETQKPNFAKIIGLVSSIVTVISIIITVISWLR